MIRADAQLVPFYNSMWREAPAIAKHHCSGHFSGADSCDWYHAAWPVLRLLDMVSTPYWHKDFFEFAVTLAASLDLADRTCIIGTADFSMTALIAAAMSRLGIDTGTITVLDRCRSPLSYSERWAVEAGIAIKTKTFDLLSRSELAGPFSLACSDSLLTRFTKEQRRSVLVQIASLLADGGLFVTTVRDRSWEPARLPMSNDEFIQRAIAGAETIGAGDDSGIERLAADYIENMKSYDAGSLTELSQDIELAGLSLLYSEQGVVKGELGPTKYNRIILRKMA